MPVRGDRDAVHPERHPVRQRRVGIVVEGLKQVGQQGRQGSVRIGVDQRLSLRAGRPAITKGHYEAHSTPPVTEVYRRVPTPNWVNMPRYLLAL